jgi:hypothetical protein
VVRSSVFFIFAVEIEIGCINGLFFVLISRLMRLVELIKVKEHLKEIHIFKGSKYIFNLLHRQISDRQ